MAAASPDEAFVHPTAVVDAGARLGAGVRVWHFVHVSAGAKVGASTVLGQGVYVGPDVQIGRGCKIQNHVSVYAGVTLADEVFVGPSAVFTNVRTPRAHVDRKHVFAPTSVERFATIGANATIVCGVRLAEGAFVAAGAVVTSDVPPYTVVRGTPARPAGHRCRCGESLDASLDASIEEGPAPRCASCGSHYARRAEGGLRYLGADVADGAEGADGSDGAEGGA